jgi:radical SAM-linked protein
MLRLLSHHDLMRTFERMLRRAALPFRSSQGFHPKPRLVFALSLPLGVVGHQEIADLELDAGLTAAEVQERLAAQAPPGLHILDTHQVSPRARSLVRALCYGLALPPERTPELRRRADEVLAAAECWVERTRPPVRRVDLRPFLRRLTILPGGAAGYEDTSAGNQDFLEMDLWLTAAGTARPEEVVGLLGLRDLLEAGAVLHRTRLELADTAPAEHTEGGQA